MLMDYNDYLDDRGAYEGVYASLFDSLDTDDFATGIGKFIETSGLGKFEDGDGFARGLFATEEVLESVPSSKEADEITKLAKKENLNADVFGPLAFDNSISKKSAAIKGIKNLVAGEADVLLVPSVETGNALVKMLIYFSGACAAGVVVGGKVPVVITSRSDEAQARLASIAAAVVALD